MPPLAVTRLARPGRTPARAAIAAMLLVFAVHRAHGQTAPARTDDATPVPRGSLRLTIAGGWTRFESRYGAGGVLRGLGDELSTDSLGPRQLPRLAPVEGAYQTLTRNPAQRLTLGRLDVRSDARVVSTPITLEYGVTRRLSVGVLVPVVQTRRSAQVRVNAHAGADTARRGNTGFIPEASRANAATANAALVNSLTTAAAGLGQLVTRCAANPAAAECTPIRGQEAAALATAARAAEFAAAVTAAYGTTQGTTFVAPLAGSQLAATIETQRAALAVQLATFAPGTQLGTLFNAPSEFSFADLQGRNGTAGLLQSDLGGGLDSLHTTERVGFGDVELRASYLLLDHVQRDSLAARGLQYRLAVGGSFRFATSLADSSRNVLDVGTGDGGGAEVRSALDVVSGRVGGTIAARYAKSFARTVEASLAGYPEGGFPFPAFGTVSRSAGSVIGVDVIPRLFVGEWLAFEGQYGLEHTSAPTFTAATGDPCSACVALASSILPAASTVQRLGLGIRYSTIESYLRGRARYPIEVSYRHLETVTGSEGSLKLFRDQIQLKIFYRVIRR